MDKTMKYWRPLHWYWKNWWLLPVVAIYTPMFWISYHMEIIAGKMNMWVLSKLKKKNLGFDPRKDGPINTTMKL